LRTRGTYGLGTLPVLLGCRMMLRLIMNESKRLRPVRHLLGTTERSADNSLTVSILESVVPFHIPLKRDDTASTDSGLGLPLQILSSALLCSYGLTS
jgi:hypothetical protein